MNIEILEIILNVNTNIPDKPTFEITSENYYVPNDTGKYNKYPFFTNSVKFPNAIVNKTRKQIKELFFTKEMFKREIVGIIAVTEQDKENNTNHNMKILMETLFPISFPIESNYHNSFNENIMQELPSFAKTISWSSYIFGNSKQYSYIKFGAEIYTITDVTWINDAINNTQYTDLFRQIAIHNKRITAEINASKGKMEELSKRFRDQYKTFYEVFKNERADIISKNDKSRATVFPPDLMNPILENFEDSSDKNVDLNLKAFIALYKLSMEAPLTWIPYYVAKLPNFNQLLTISQNYYMYSELTTIYLPDLSKFIDLINKPATEVARDKWDSYMQQQLKSRNQLVKIIDVIKPYRHPNSNSEKDSMINYQYVTNKNLQALFDKFGKNEGINEQLQMVAEFIQNVKLNNIQNLPKIDMSNLDLGLIIDVKKQTTEDKDAKKGERETVFGANAQTRFNASLNMNFVKGELTQLLIKDIKCEFENSDLIHKFENLNAPAKNIYLVYRKTPLIDITAMTNKNKTQKQMPKSSNNTTRKTGGRKNQKGGFVVPNSNASIRRGRSMRREDTIGRRHKRGKKVDEQK